MSLLVELKKPYNALSTAIGIIGLVLGIWLYYISVERREPYYLAHDVVQVFDSKVATPKIRLSDEAGTAVTDSVYLIEVSVWNDGKHPIEPSDVRIPLALQVQGAERILDYSVVAENQPRISKIRVTPIKDQPSLLGLGFAHLDPGLGARIKIVYAGTANAKVSLNGAIVGTKIKDGSSSIYNYLPRWLTTIMSAILGVVAADFGKALIRRVSSDWPAGRRRFIKTAIFAGTIAILLLLLRLIFGSTLPPV